MAKKKKDEGRIGRPLQPQQSQGPSKEEVASKLIDYLSGGPAGGQGSQGAQGGAVSGPAKSERPAKNSKRPPAAKEYSNTPTTDYKDRAKSRRSKEAEAQKRYREAMKKPRTEALIDRFKGKGGGKR